MSFNIKNAPDWQPDPLVQQWTLDCMQGLADQISAFLLAAASRVLDPNIVALYAESRKNIPGLNAELLIHSPRRHSIRVFFRDHEIASCTFETNITSEGWQHVAKSPML